MTISIDDALTLLKQIVINGLSCQQFHTVVGPCRSLWLEIESHLICCSESGLRGAIGMETHVVQTVFLTLLEDSGP